MATTTTPETAAADEQLRRDLIDRALNHGVTIDKAVEVAANMFEFIKNGKK